MAAALHLTRLASRSCLNGALRSPMVALGMMYVSPRYGLGPVTRHPHSIFGKGAGNMGVVQTSHIHATSSVMAGGAGRHWAYERLVAVGLLGLVPAAFVAPAAVVNYSLAVLVPLHGHWGIESVIEDYFPQSLKLLSRLLLYGVSISTFVGLLYFNYTDVGICRAIKMIWML